MYVRDAGSEPGDPPAPASHELCFALVARYVKQLSTQPFRVTAVEFTHVGDAAAYRAVVTAAGLEPQATAMFDDIAHNLAAAQALGMTTVWLNTGADFSSGAPAGDAPHHETDDLPRFLLSLRI